MQVETPNGKVFEGIFSTWSPDFELVLEQAHEVSSAAAPEGTVTDVTDKMIFPKNQIVRCHAADVDLDYATKGKWEQL